MPNARLNALISEIRDSHRSDFYRRRWDPHMMFEDLPKVSRADFISVPLSERRYKSGRTLVKIVHTPKEAFLSEWDFSDIAADDLGISAERPMVYLRDPHEALSMSMWFYEHEMLPLIGEKDPDIAAYAAGRYDIDALVADRTTFEQLYPHLRSLHARLSSVVIVGDDLAGYIPHHAGQVAETVRLVLSLPEVGVFASAALAKQPVFAPCAGCVVELDETLVVSKARLLVTPVIRYQTDIAASAGADGVSFTLRS